MTATWIDSLSDTGIKSDLETMLADGSFSFSDALTLLKDVAASGSVTSAQFADLQTIAGNLETQNGISASGYVTSLFYQLVEGSQANASWNGGSATASALGDLAVGSSTAQLGQLIAKWFLGTDLPDPTANGDGTSQTLHPTYADYSAYKLFGTSGTPQVTDVAQGYDGDCELCSGMIELLQNHPGLLQSMFVDNGDGTYGVRFYVNGKETWVTVNSELPTYQGELLYNDGLLSSNDGMWANLIEKAYAQLSADGEIDHPSVNSYDNISADTAFDVLTNLTNTSAVQYLLSSSTNWNAYKSIIVAAIQAGDDVMVETGTTSSDYTTNSKGQELLVADHAYAVVGYDSATGDLIVRNPWGVVPNDNSFVTQFEVSMADIAKVGGDVVFDNSAASDIVFNFAEQVVYLAATANSSFSLASSAFSANSSVRIASLVQPLDTVGLAISEYKIDMVGTGGIDLNGATNLSTAANEVIVSAADFAKLTLSTGSAGGDIDLFISGYDANGWATPTELYWTVDSSKLTILPAVDTIVAPLAKVSIASLFQVGGSVSTAGLDYFVAIDSGGGTIALNGATDLLGGDGSGGQIEVSAADLAKLTYTNPGTAGVVVLDITATDGTNSSDLTQVAVDVGYSVSAALAAFDAGTTPYQIALVDSAADIFANLAQLELMMPNWNLLGISLTDSTIPTETITSAELTADRGVLSIIDSTMVLDVTASGANESITGLSNMATVVVFSGTASAYSLTAGSGVVEVAGASGTASVSGAVALQFADHEVIVASTIPVSGEAVSSAQITNLYAAVFAREPDVAGLNFYEQYAAANPTVGIVTYADYFLSSTEYTSTHTYDQTTTGETKFITDTYQNLLNRTPDSAEISYYLNVIDQMLAAQTTDKVAHATVLTYFSQSTEFLSDVKVTSTVDAQHWLVLV